MPTLTDRSIDTDQARAIARDWHGGQTSGLYALASSGHVNGRAYRETWENYRYVTDRQDYGAAVAERADHRRELAALIRYLRVNAFHDVNVCEDCYQMHHYGTTGCNPHADDTPDSDAWLLRDAAVADAYTALGGDQYVSDNTDSETGAGIDTFSWSTCGCCKSTLGGARYRLNVERH